MCCFTGCSQLAKQHSVCFQGICVLSARHQYFIKVSLSEQIFLETHILFPIHNHTHKSFRRNWIRLDIEQRKKTISTSSFIMQISCNFLFVLVPFISIGFSVISVSDVQKKTNTKPGLECAAGSSVEVNLDNDFWIEVVFLKSTAKIKFLQPDCTEDSNVCDNQPEPFRPDYPLWVQDDYNPFEGARLSRPIICRGFEVRSLFIVKYDTLFGPNQRVTEYWPDAISNWTYRGFNAISFGYAPEFDFDTNYLTWSIVKVCGKHGTELHLQARDDVNRKFFFPLSSLFPDPPFRMIIIEECQTFMKSFLKVNNKKMQKKKKMKTKFVKISKFDSAK